MSLVCVYPIPIRQGDVLLMFRCYFLLTFSIARYKAGVHQNVVAHEILLPLRANQQQRRCWIITITRRSTRSIHIGVKRRLLESSANLCLQQKAALLANVGNQPKTRGEKILRSQSCDESERACIPRAGATLSSSEGCTRAYRYADRSSA